MSRPLRPRSGGPLQGGLFDAPAAPEARPAARPAAAAVVPAGAPAQREILSVGELTRAIKGTLESRFQRVRVRGEISGYRGPHPRGHLFFSLKDADAAIEVKVWASVAQRLRFRLREGLSVLVEGSIDVWAPQGRYSLIVQRIEPVGEGALALAFQQLKERLQEEGLFGERRLRPQRPIPLLPKRIGVVTSRSGAALQDFLRVALTRNPKASILVCDARVQGDGAAAEIESGLQRLARAGVDVIVVTRGGGSVEDLWAFNEERVARAIHACPVPVVSAVGHEVDFTIADFVADLRAPTPSAAAERLAPVLAELEGDLDALFERLCRGVERGILLRRGQLGQLEHQLPDPRHLTGSRRRQLARARERLSERMHRALREARTRHGGLTERLERQQPRARLARNRTELSRLSQRLEQAMRRRLSQEHRGLQKARLALQEVHPRDGIAEARRRLGTLALSLRMQVPAQLAAHRAHLRGLVGRLEAVSPLAVLSRGYALAFRESDGALLRGARDVEVGEALRLRLAPRGATELADCEVLRVQVTGREAGPDDNGSTSGTDPGPKTP